MEIQNLLFLSIDGLPELQKLALLTDPPLGGLSRLLTIELFEFGGQTIPFLPQDGHFVFLARSPRFLPVDHVIEAKVQDVLFDDLFFLHVTDIDFFFDDLFLLHVADIDFLFDNLFFLLFDFVERDRVASAITIQLQRSECSLGLCVQIDVLHLVHLGLFVIELSTLDLGRYDLFPQWNDAIDHVKKQIDRKSVVFENVCIGSRTKSLVLLEGLGNSFGRHQNQWYLLEFLVFLNLRTDRIAAHLRQFHAQHNQIKGA